MGWIIALVILLLLVLLLRLQVGVRVLFGETQTVWLKIGPLMRQVYPQPEGKAEKTKQAKKEKKKKEKEPDASGKVKKKRHITFDAVWQLISALTDPVLDAMNRVRKGLRFHQLNCRLVIADGDPAKAAQRYGNINAVLWPLLAVVEHTVTVEHRKVDIGLDFAAQKSCASGEVYVTMRLHHGVRILLRDGFAVIRAILAFMKATKAENTEEKKDNAQAQTPAA